MYTFESDNAMIFIKRFNNSMIKYQMKIRLIFIYIFFAAFYLSAQRQSDIPVMNKSAELYLETVENYATIYSGRQEPKYFVKTVNHPYLDTQEFRTGTLSIDGCVYTDIPMRLNHYIDELTVISPNKYFSVIVPRENFDYAIIDSLYIVDNKLEDIEGSILQEGYFVRIYNGESEVWKRRKSVLNTRIRDNEFESYFEQHTNIYVYKDGAYFPVSNKRSVFKLFDSKKKELKRKFRQSGLTYNKDPEKAIVVIAGFYDETDN